MKSKNLQSLSGQLKKAYLKHRKHHKKGQKFDQDKPPMELLSHLALVEVAKVFGHGAKKYDKYNYRAGIAYSRILGAAHRHLGSFNSGEDLDNESGLSHIAHLAACAIMLLDYIRECPEMDDRYKTKKKVK